MGHAVCADGLIPLMARLSALRALLFDVRDLAVGPDLAIAAGHTPAGQRREAQESDKAHTYNLGGGHCNRRTYYRSSHSGNCAVYNLREFHGSL